MNRGKYIVIEGPEGVGKTTQLHELARRLQAAGLPVRTMREPDSQSDLTARAIRQLTQDPRYPMNTRTEVLLYNAARAQSLQVIKQSVDHGVICLVDRNYLTTLAIQYYGRGDVPDYQTINSIISFAVGGVEPDLCILLDAPVNILRDRLKYRYNGERFDNLTDEFLERVRAGYLWEAHQRKLPVVFATDEPEQVADNIWKLASAVLAVRESTANVEGVTNATSVKEIIEQKKLPEPPVLLEKTNNNEVVTGDLSDEESLKQPADIIQVRLDGVSYMAAPAFISPLIGGQLANITGDQRYYLPEYLKESVAAQYRQGMDMIFASYDDMLERLQSHLSNDSDAKLIAKDTLQAVLPLAANAAINLTATRAQMHDLITDLMSQGLPEAREIGETLSEQGHAEIPVLLEEDTAPDGDQSTANYLSTAAGQVKLLANEHLTSNYTTTAEAVSLVDFWPKNEMLLVPEMLYEHSNQSMESLQAEVGGWPYARKTAVFKAYIGQRQSLRHRPGRAMEKPHYSWDIVSDYVSFLGLQQQAAADDLNWQAPTPRYGYETPKLIEQAGLTEQFEACFNASLKLHSYLQKAGYPLEAQYATLMGHKLRWKATYNARQAFRLLETPYTHTPTLALISQIQEKLAEVHPLTAESIKPSA